MSSLCKVECFSTRRLSPFRGTLQIIKTPNGRAVTGDGVVWQIQLWHQHKVLRWGGLGKPGCRWGYLVIGVWCREVGFDRFPLDPSMNVAEIETAADDLISVCRQCIAKLPFKPTDNIELWLLDKERRLPLALLASTSDPSKCVHVTETCWKASLPGDHSFVSETLSRDQEYARQLHRGSAYHRDALAALVMNTAGNPAAAQWFERNDDGEALGLEGTHLDPSLVQRSLPRELFPELMLREHWLDSRAQALVHDFHVWQAPQLLTLPHLNRTTRAFWESHARPQAELVERLHRLYPEIIDVQGIKAALIEVAIRRAGR